MIEEFEDDFEFEETFLKRISNFSDYELFMNPLIDGSFLTEEDKARIKYSARQKKIPILYLITIPNLAILVFTSSNDILGIMPIKSNDENELH